MYNIPVNIWIPHSYPHTPPFVFVTPTDSMVIKESKNVDTTGKAHLPYLHYWPSRPDQCNLVELVRMLCVIFGQQPPVYNKPSQTAAPVRTPTSPSKSSVAHSASTSPTITSNYAPTLAISDLSISTSSPSLSSVPMPPTSSQHYEMYPSTPANKPQHQPRFSATHEKLPIENEPTKASLQSAVFTKIQQQLKATERAKTYEIENFLRINSQLKENSQKLTQAIKSLNEEDKKMDLHLEFIRQKIRDMKDFVNSSEMEHELDVDEITLTHNTIHHQ